MFLTLLDYSYRYICFWYLQIIFQYFFNDIQNIPLPLIRSFGDFFIPEFLIN